MKKCVLCIIIFISAILFYFNCNGDLLEEGLETDTAGTLDLKHRGIWIVGGLSGTGIGTTVGSIDLYDPVTDSWNPAVTTLQTSVSFAAVAAYNEKIYVIGGYDNGGNISATNQIYDILTGQWSSGSITGFSARAHINASIINGKIYIIGGVANAASNGTYSAATTIQEYNIASNTWSTLIPSPALGRTAGSEMGCVAYNNVIYFFGGRTALNVITNINDGYSLAGNAATTATEILINTGTNSRSGFATVIYKPANDIARIIILGGFANTTTAGIGTTGNYILNGATTSALFTGAVNYLNYPFSGPPASPWPAFSNSLPALSFGSAVIVDSTLYFFGGTTSYNTGVQSTVYSFDLTGLPSGSWTSRSAMSNGSGGRIGHAAVTFNQ